jgi:uncharacterized protein YxjI
MHDASIKQTTMKKFFDHNYYIINQKVQLLKMANEYQVLDDTGQPIGKVKEKLGSGGFILRLLINKAMLPFKLEIADNNEQVQATISRGFTFFMSKIQVTMPDGSAPFFIKQKFKMFKAQFDILDQSGQKIGSINGDWKAWNFSIVDMSGTEIGRINKQWAGALKELFTTADKYMVTLDKGDIEYHKKVAIISAAITVDMVLKNGNNR